MTEDSGQGKDLASLAPVFRRRLTVTVIGGMAKTGTTLPLTLLDGHPDLVVFPEEFRFFHTKADRRNGLAAAEAFLANGNTRRLSEGLINAGQTDYRQHGGTGFGVTDYSGFDYSTFDRLVRAGFAKARKPLDRLRVVVGAFMLCSGMQIDSEDPIHFVCKAPHNEKYVLKWRRMLGRSGRFIQCTRDPIEHYLSLMNIAKLYQYEPMPAADYARKVRRRMWLWHLYPSGSLYVLDYDKLVSSPETEMKRIAHFMGIPFLDSMTVPTKAGRPWLGNSSRGAVSPEVFPNPRIAREIIPRQDQLVIESYLRGAMKRMNWALVG